MLLFSCECEAFPRKSTERFSSDERLELELVELRVPEPELLVIMKKVNAVRHKEFRASVLLVAEDANTNETTCARQSRAMRHEAERIRHKVRASKSYSLLEVTGITVMSLHMFYECYGMLHM